MLTQNVEKQKKKNRWRATAFLDPSWNPSERYYVFWGSWRRPGPGPGPILLISSDRDDRMVAKIKTQKNPRAKIKPPKNPTPNFRAIKISRRTYVDRIRGNYHESSDCFENPKKFLLKSSCPKNYLPKFSYPNNSRNRKCQTQKHPSIIPVTWNPE